MAAAPVRLRSALGAGATLDPSPGADISKDIFYDGHRYDLRIFETLGSHALTVSKGGDVDFLIVAGGGAGGGSIGGGGGAGGVIQKSGHFLMPGTYTIVVGDGSKGNTIGTPQRGGESRFGPFVAIGGGAGVGGNDGKHPPRCNGGSGGGGGFNSGDVWGEPVDLSQGHRGGVGKDNNQVLAPGHETQGGGGGGYSGRGQDATRRFGLCNGGDGLATTITGRMEYFAGGGGGGVYKRGGIGAGGGGV